MVWGALGYQSTGELVEITTTMDAVKYQVVLERGLIGKGTRMAGRGFIFQQDNASCHSARSPRTGLKPKKSELWIGHPEALTEIQ